MVTKMYTEFEKIFGSPKDARVYFAPGRVNLIGEHTDYNGGHVFPCALTLGTYGAVKDRDDSLVCLYSMNFPDAGVIRLDLSQPLVRDPSGSWANHAAGVIWSFGKRGCKPAHGLDILIAGNIPNGSGLSSSASLEVLIGLILKDTFRFEDVSMTDIALIGQDAENNFNGCSCGIMDQFASAMGKKGYAIFLDTNTLKYEYAPVILPDEQIIITNSLVKHNLVDSAYNDRRRECETALKELQQICDITSLGDLSVEKFESVKSAITDPVCQKRAKHAVYENERTIQAVDALKQNDIRRFGALMNASHTSLRDDYEVSCEEIDFLVDAAQKLPGVLGSRITGGGFGGCTVSIVKKEAAEEFRTRIGAAYKEKFGLAAEFYMADIGDGAHKVSETLPDPA